MISKKNNGDGPSHKWYFLTSFPIYFEIDQNFVWPYEKSKLCFRPRFFSSIYRTTTGRRS